MRAMPQPILSATTLLSITMPHWRKSQVFPSCYPIIFNEEVEEGRGKEVNWESRREREIGRGRPYEGGVHRSRPAAGDIFWQPEYVFSPVPVLLRLLVKECDPQLVDQRAEVPKARWCIECVSRG